MKALLALSALALTACSSADYIRYADTQASIQTARYNAESARFKAMASIADKGDTTTRVAAMMALQGSGNSTQAQQVQAPKSGWDTFREMVGIVLPATVQAYGIHANQITAVAQSNNARDIGMSTNQTFLRMAQEIQAPAIPAANMSIAGDGVIGSGSAIKDSYSPVSTSDTNTITNTSMPP